MESDKLAIAVVFVSLNSDSVTLASGSETIVTKLSIAGLNNELTRRVSRVGISTIREGKRSIDHN
jgi:hypothetical protein